MEKEIKKGIKKALVLDSFIGTTSTLSKILDETEKELNEVFGDSKKNKKKLDDFFKKISRE